MTVETEETPPRKVKHIALVAHSQRTRDIGPWNNDDWFVFGLNNIHRFIPKLDMLIQIHERSYLASHPAYSKEDLTFYEQTKLPVITLRHEQGWPTSQPMPIDELDARYGKIIPNSDMGTPWVSTMTYMVGLAMLWIEKGEFPEPYKDKFVPSRTFGMWGFDALDDYSQQGPSIAFLAGICYARGINFVIPKSSGFLREPFRYGYENRANAMRRRQIDTRNAELQAGKKQLEQKIAQRNAEMQQLQTRVISMQSQIEENNYQRKNWTDDFDDDSKPDGLSTGMAISRVARGGAESA